MKTRGQGRVVAWIDASAGLAGDMLLGALLDLGAELEAVQECIDSVVPETVRVSVSDTKRGGLRAAQAHVELVAEDQQHRRWAEIRDRIAGAQLPERTRFRALAAFEALARVEAAAHGTEIDEVEFHEVGSWDSIADVVGVCAGLEDLGVDEVVVSRIAVGSGFVRGSHGRLPVPGPAVAGLLQGWQVESGGDGELATPTGVALVTTLAAEQGPIPPMQLVATGVGAGTADPEGIANVTRIALGLRVSSTHSSGSAGADGVVARPMTLLEANIDDLDPRVWPSVVDALLDAGAADAWLTPIVMKRGRPAQVLSVLAHREDAESLRDLIFELTSTIGLRESEIRRWELARGWVTVEVDGSHIGVKVAHRDGRIVQATPEFRDVAAAADVLRRSVRDVLEAARAAASHAGLARGRTLPEGLRS
jgi:hypothetical protein